MNLTEPEIDTLIKYLPEDKIPNILNFQVLIGYICDKYSITEYDLNCSSRKTEITKARFYLVILAIKIFAPYTFEDNVIKGIKTKTAHGIAKMLSIAIGKHYTAPRYYLNKCKDFLQTGQMDIEEINILELEALNKMEL